MNLWLTIATVFEYGTLVLLFGLSIWSISIIIDRQRFFSGETGSTSLEGLRTALKSKDIATVKTWTKNHPGLHAGVLNAAEDFVANGNIDHADRSVRAFLSNEKPRYEKGLSTLATLGANAPFIGLFGTVLGIIRAFAALGDSTGAAASVMSGISLALIATAAGLFVAIPAVVAFNVFSSRWKALLAECDSVKDLMIAHLTRERGV